MESQTIKIWSSDSNFISFGIDQKFIDTYFNDFNVVDTKNITQISKPSTNGFVNVIPFINRENFVKKASFFINFTTFFYCYK